MTGMKFKGLIVGSFVALALCVLTIHYQSPLQWLYLLLSALVLGPLSWCLYVLYEHTLPNEARALDAPPKYSTNLRIQDTPQLLVYLAGIPFTFGLFFMAQLGQALIAQNLAFGLLLFILLAQICLSDWRERLIADLHLLGLFFLVGVFVLLAPDAGYATTNAIVGLLLGLGVIGLTAIVGSRLGFNQLGVGDLYLAAGIGMLVGHQAIMALLVAGAVQTVLFACRKFSRAHAHYQVAPHLLPMGPSLCLGGLGLWLYGLADQSKNILVISFL